MPNSERITPKEAIKSLAIGTGVVGGAHVISQVAETRVERGIVAGVGFLALTELFRRVRKQRNSQ